MHISLGAGGGQTMGIRVSFYRIQGMQNIKRNMQKEYFYYFFL
jgi:hypothetical protein